MRSILLAAALAAGPAMADQISTQGADTLRLTQRACPAEVLALVPSEYHAEMRYSVGTVDGKSYPGCWLERYGLVFVAYADGDLGRVPAEMFKPALDAL